MPKFNFRLTTLLRLRRLARDERRVELAEAERADDELQAQLARLDEQQERLQSEYRRLAAPGQLDVSRLIEAGRYVAALRSQEEQLGEQRRALAVEIGRRRGVLLEADRDLQTLEKLRENQLEAHRQEENRQEAKQLDEAALQTVER